MKNNKNILFAFVLFVSLAACKKQENNTQNNSEENELITTVKLHFIDTVSQDTSTYAWRQPAGQGTAITVDSIVLKANKNYITQVELLDESKSPAIDISSEIKELANEHRFFYTCSNQDVQVTILDFDTQNPPMELGLMFHIKSLTQSPWLGSFTVQLKHYPSTSPKAGGASNGSTDIEVQFPMRME